MELSNQPALTFFGRWRVPPAAVVRTNLEHVYGEAALGDHVEHGKAHGVALRIPEEAEAFCRDQPPAWKGRPREPNRTHQAEVVVREVTVGTAPSCPEVAHGKEGHLHEAEEEKAEGRDSNGNALVGDHQD